VEWLNSKGNMMPDSKFTKGPWRVNDPLKAGSELWVYSDETYLGTVSNLLMAPKEILANAELMADAPRLLEVLRKVLAYADFNPNWDGIDEEEAERAFTEADGLLEKHGG
jgi:hypothetical protein